MTAHEPADQPCCDEAGWLLGADGTPRDPAEVCTAHPEKRTQPPKKAAGKSVPDKPLTAARQGNKDKFAWFYAMMADPEVSLKGKAIGAACVMKMAGHKGHFKATRKAVANLCGTSIATVRRALDDLIDTRYLDVEYGEGAGAANTYTLISPAQRCEEWLNAETEYQRGMARAENKMRNWLHAEKKWCEQQQELPFRTAIVDACLARGATPVRAHQIADQLVGKYRDQGIDLDIEGGLAAVSNAPDDRFTTAGKQPAGDDTDPAQKRADPGSPLSRPRLTPEPTPAQRRADPGSPLSRPRLTPDTPTSADDQTHKSFKDSERPIKVFQDLESEPALRDARKTRALRPVRPSAGQCELCGPDGLFRDTSGLPVVLVADSDGDYFNEHPVQCQHSMAGNLAEIQRREKAENLALCKTGWPDIDSHYPLFRD